MGKNNEVKKEKEEEKKEGKKEEKDYMTLRNEKRAKRLAAREKRAKKGF